MLQNSIAYTGHLEENPNFQPATGEVSTSYEALLVKHNDSGPTTMGIYKKQYMYKYLKKKNM